MTEKELYQILGEIDPVMIEAAAPDAKTRKIKISCSKWIAVAACFALVLLTCVLPLRESPEGTVASLFTITARAADGEKIELEYGSYLLNSGSQGNIFGVDMPTFNFTILPSDLENNEAVFSRFNISVSYKFLNNKHILPQRETLSGERETRSEKRASSIANLSSLNVNR